ncbi:MAG: LPS-assembly protein LptD [Deltaproteobacteria bacterium]|nr:LPS-assembly protein LptD [Deltaproteobacteria bacterium]
MYYKYIKAFFFIFIGFIIAFDCYAKCLSEAEQKKAEAPWRISADEVKYNKDKDQFAAKGNVVIKKANRLLTADFVTFDKKKMTASAVGNVIFITGEDKLEGTGIDINLANETGIVYDASLFYKKTNFYIKGDHIEKTSKNSYKLKQGSFTSCTGAKPAWQITGKNMKVTLNGYGTATNIMFKVKDMPIFYSPFIIFPAKTERQSGFLMPALSYSSRKGVDITLPYFWAIDKNQDTTFYLNHIGERGEKLGAEYRYKLTENSKGTLMLDFLHDKERDNDFNSDGYIRTNSDRYWLRGRVDHLLPSDFAAKLVLDMPSDQDYLTEFKTGMTGYNETNEYYEENFYTSLEDYTDYVRKNRLNISKSWDKYILNIDGVMYEDIRVGLDRRQDKSFYKLPSIAFDALKQKMGDTPLYFDFKSLYFYYYGENTPKEMKADIYSRFYLPLSIAEHFHFEPSVGLRAAYTKIYDYKDNTPNYSSTDQTYDVRLDLSSLLFNIFDTDIKNIEKIKHTIIPRITYEYVPEEKIASYFEEEIETKNLITYSITNNLIAKQNLMSDISDKKNKIAYNRFLRFKISQSYDFNKETEPFSDIAAEAYISLGKYLFLTGEAEWSPYTGDFTSHDKGITIRDNRDDALSLEHRYKKGESESIAADINLKIDDNMEVYGSYEKNLYTGSSIEYKAGFLYGAQCWALALEYLNEKDGDTKFEVLLKLKGLGDF